MTLQVLHSELATLVLLYTLGVGAWGLLSYAQRQPMSLRYWLALAGAEMLLMTQGGLGAVLWYLGGRPGQAGHVLYGAATALGIPLVYGFTRGRGGRMENLAYAVAVLISGGLTLLAALSARG